MRYSSKFGYDDSASWQPTNHAQRKLARPRRVALPPPLCVIREVYTKARNIRHALSGTTDEPDIIAHVGVSN